MLAPAELQDEGLLREVAGARQGMREKEMDQEPCPIGSSGLEVIVSMLEFFFFFFL